MIVLIAGDAQRWDSTGVTVAVDLWVCSHFAIGTGSRVVGYLRFSHAREFGRLAVRWPVAL